MSDFPEEWKYNQTEEKLTQERAKSVHDYITWYEPDNIDLKFTCDNCTDRNICGCAYDCYNLDGDCLMNK